MIFPPSSGGTGYLDTQSASTRFFTAHSGRSSASELGKNEVDFAL